MTDTKTDKRRTPLALRSVAHRAAGEIARALVNGAYPPGSKLPAGVIADRCKVTQEAANIAQHELRDYGFLAQLYEHGPFVVTSKVADARGRSLPASHISEMTSDDLATLGIVRIPQPDQPDETALDILREIRDTLLRQVIELGEKRNQGWGALTAERKRTAEKTEGALSLILNSIGELGRAMPSDEKLTAALKRAEDAERALSGYRILLALHASSLPRQFDARAMQAGAASVNRLQVTSDGKNMLVWLEPVA